MARKGLPEIGAPICRFPDGKLAFGPGLKVMPIASTSSEPARRAVSILGASTATLVDHSALAQGICWPSGTTAER